MKEASSKESLNKQLTKFNSITKYRKMPIFHYLSANSHTCGSDAISFVRSMSSLEVTLIERQTLGLLGFCLQKIGGGCTHFRSQLVKIFILTILEF